MQWRSRSGFAGGIGLVACGVIAVLGMGISSSVARVALAVLGAVLWGAAVFVLTFGLSRRESIVARSRSALIAAVVLATWPTIDAVVRLLLIPSDLRQANAWATWGFVSPVVLLMSGAIVAAQVMRARTVPAPWSRMPLWVLGAQSAIWVVPQILGTAAPAALVDAADLLFSLRVLGLLLTTFGLGFVALLLSISPQSPTDTAPGSSD